MRGRRDGGRRRGSTAMEEEKWRHERGRVVFRTDAGFSGSGRGQGIRREKYVHFEEIRLGAFVDAVQWRPTVTRGRINARH